MASRAAATLFFSVFFFGKNYDEILTKKKKNGQNEKKKFHSAVIKSPGRWTGNNIFLRLALNRHSPLFGA